MGWEVRGFVESSLAQQPDCQTGGLGGRFEGHALCWLVSKPGASDVPLRVPVDERLFEGYKASVAGCST